MKNLYSQKPPSGHYSTLPILSTDKSWLCWKWAFKEENAESHELGTILIDLDSKEFKSIDGYWTNVQWSAYSAY